MLNNTRNNEDIGEKWREARPSLCLSAVWKWEPWDRMPCAWTLGLWPCRSSPHPGLPESTQLVTGFRHHSLPTPHRIVHHGSLSTNTMKITTSSPKSRNPSRATPHKHKNEITFLQTETHFLTLFNHWRSSFSWGFRFLHFRPRGKILVKEFDVNCTDSGENRNGSSNRENSVFGLFPLSLCRWPSHPD